ncbi:unnamed protein product [Urochloa decumbens]|uniref:F-box domain-containing protein n=1 Tax=Urochloa decumbens TaxID=240449 RepID=A0ABC9CF95_9POAL
MEVAAKRARAGGGSAPDRLSALPDELIRCVLSFLPSRQAVQTTMLSKRWVDLWRSVPAINVDSTDILGTDGCAGWEKIKYFTTNLLMLHNAQFLDVIRLWLYAIVNYSPHPDTTVDRWVSRVIKHHPVVLEICFCRSLGHNFQIPLVGSAFCRLKTLKLDSVSLDHCFAERLNSGCPVLEDLVLDHCRNEFDAIRSDTLKNVVIHYCSSRTASVLVIKAPCLTSLSLKFPYCFYRDVWSWMVLVQWRSSISERDVHKFKALGTFLQKSPNLEKLTLKDFWYFEGSEREVQRMNEPRLKAVRPVVGPIEFPMLENLGTLFLVKCDLRDNFRILRHFLRSSPNLEMLTVQCCKLPKCSVGRKGK